MSSLLYVKKFLPRKSLHLALLTVGLQSAGCGLIEDRTNRYVDERRGAEMVVPDRLSKQALRDDYPVPQVDQQRALSRDFEVPPPPEAEMEVLAEEYSLRRSDDQVWLLVNEEPGRVWPALARFWEEQGLQVPYTVPKSGLMQTTVAGNSARSRELLNSLGLNPDGQYYFQVKLEQGLRRRTSEIAVRAIAGEQPTAALDQTWQQADTQVSVEEPLLERVKTFMEKDESNRSYSLLAQDISGGTKVFFMPEENPPHIRLNLSFDRAWNSIGKALEETEIPVVDLNRSEGVYLINYDPNKRSSSWLPDWLKPGSGSQLSDQFNYRLILERIGDTIHVRAEGAGEPVGRDQQIQLLSRILDNLA